MPHNCIPHTMHQDLPNRLLCWSGVRYLSPVSLGFSICGKCYVIFGEESTAEMSLCSLYILSRKRQEKIAWLLWDIAVRFGDILTCILGSVYKDKSHIIISRAMISVTWNGNFCLAHWIADSQCESLQLPFQLEKNIKIYTIHLLQEMLSNLPEGLMLMVRRERKENNPLGSFCYLLSHGCMSEIFLLNEITGVMA